MAVEPSLLLLVLVVLLLRGLPRQRWMQASFQTIIRCCSRTQPSCASGAPSSRARCNASCCCRQPMASPPACAAGNANDSAPDAVTACARVGERRASAQISSGRGSPPALAARWASVSRPSGGRGGSGRCARCRRPD